jgi:signal transduction histidine kinase
MKPSDPAWLDRLAHDLRGPLAPLQTASYLLQRDDLEPARRQELLAMLERQTRRLGRMLDELDDWIRAGRERLLGEREEAELALLLDYALVGSGIRNAQVDDDGHIALVRGDPQRLTQLLRTLFDFALARGRLSRVVLRSGEGRASLDVVVADGAAAGSGAAGLLDAPQREPYDEGLGLRLLLAREIARAHGGELSANADGGELHLRCVLPVVEPAQG